jgi:uncharacterized membrane protein YgcG
MRGRQWVRLIGSLLRPSPVLAAVAAVIVANDLSPVLAGDMDVWTQHALALKEAARPASWIEILVVLGLVVIAAGSAFGIVVVLVELAREILIFFGVTLMPRREELQHHTDAIADANSSVDAFVSSLDGSAGAVSGDGGSFGGDVSGGS